MDPTHFDHLTQLCDAAGGRRAVLGALLGAVLGGTVTEATAKNKKRRKKKRRDKRAPAQVLVCYNGETLRVPREGVEGILLAGGTQGPCQAVAPAPGGETPGPGPTCAGAFTSGTTECFCLATVGGGFTCTTNNIVADCEPDDPTCPAGSVCATSPCASGDFVCVPSCPSPLSCTCGSAPANCAFPAFVKCGTIPTGAAQPPEISLVP